MDPTVVASMIFTLLIVLLIGGFIVLLPITRRLGLLIESKVQKEKDRQPAITADQLRQLGDAIQELDAQVQRLLERQDFVEKMLVGRERTSLPPPPAAPGQPGR